MASLNLDTGIRDALVERIILSLEGAVPGSIALLRGSLAAGNADAYSDIDILWEIPDDRFQVAVNSIGEILSKAGPVEFLRSDPAFQNSAKRRLFFVQFQDIPLFWRADIDLFAQSAERNPEYDVNNAAARGDDWSLTHSALMNAIAAVKALLRQREELARQLLRRGFERIGLAEPEGEPQELILKLAADVARADPTRAKLAGRVMELHRQAFGRIDRR